MKAVMLMFDSLNRHMLSPYGCAWTHTPNFQRLAERTATFDTAYCCSMPCMPARRELHTGRPNLLECNWGAIQPYDDSMPRMLSEAGVQTHLASDHFHYWEENAPNYHTQYRTWEAFRGQEGDPWIGWAGPVEPPAHINAKGRDQDWINRRFIQHEHQWSLVQTVNAGIDYIRRNAPFDRWFCQIECFDPHEPWFVPRHYKDIYEKLRDYDGPLFDWPGYGEVSETREQVEIARHNYAALLAMCDVYLGNVLDVFDELDLWRDTMLIVNTDHGFLLGEHGWWAKNTPPWWEELSHIPLFIHDPRCPQAAGSRRESFVQTIDLAPTLLRCFDLEPTAAMTGVDLAPVIAGDRGGRAAGLFGGFGHYVSVTDGRYIYMRAPVRDDGQPLNEYGLTLMNLRGRMQRGETVDMQMVDGFAFTHGQPTMRVAVPPGRGRHAAARGHLLYDLATDPGQHHPLDDATLEQRMTRMLIEQMQAVDAPPEQYVRLGLERPV